MSYVYKITFLTGDVQQPTAKLPKIAALSPSSPMGWEWLRLTITVTSGAGNSQLSATDGGRPRVAFLQRDDQRGRT